MLKAEIVDVFWTINPYRIFIIIDASYNTIFHSYTGSVYQLSTVYTGSVLIRKSEV